MKKKIFHISGLTLIEVLVTTVILGMLGAGLLTLQYVLGENQTLIVKSYMNIDKANASVATFIREIRGARSGDNAAYALEVVNDNEIVFYSDIDFDDDTEKVRYTRDGTQLIKGVIEPVGYPATYLSDLEKTEVITDKVRNDAAPTFYYYNGDWPQDIENNPLVQNERLSETRTVGIFLKLNQSANDPRGDYLLESSGQIRMLKDNL